MQSTLVNFTETENELRCHFHGDFDSYNCSLCENELVTHINPFIDDHDLGRVVFDFEHVRYISSALIRLCLFYCKLVGTKQFSVEHVSEDQKKVFLLTGLIDLLHIS
ncbi:MAG: STAS domain-containing protein [Thermoguttaceae bacterium]